jgi:hypothetical protein
MLNKLGERQQGQDLDQSQQLQVVEGLHNGYGYVDIPTVSGRFFCRTKKCSAQFKLMRAYNIVKQIF